jgi:ATP-dependent HslUV protease ATP-binding subunit HslU
MTDKLSQLTPQQIVAELDKYIIGQKDAKKNVAIALRNRWRRMNAPEDMRREITPNNILMIGSTGVGKTEIARRLAKLADAPFCKVEASKFTEVGYVGRDVESMVRDLVENSIHIVQLNKKEAVKERAMQAVEDIILDALIPPVKRNDTVTGFQSDIPTDMNHNGIDDADEVLNEKTRELFRAKIKTGELDHRKIEINVQQANQPGVSIMGGPMDEMAMMNIQEMIGGMLPKRNRTRKVTIEEAKKILIDEEAEKLIDFEEVKEEAIRKAENLGIIFIDEIDKIASNRGGGGSPDVSREGVQRDMLPIVEGSTVNTKYGTINTDHILFIAAGAFHVSKPSDLIPEFQGRFPIRVELQSLTQADFYKILKEPKNALTRQYEAMMASESVVLSFNDDALESLARIAFDVNTEVENIGARRLQTVMSHLLNDFMFDIPDVIGANAQVVITKELVEERLSGLVKNRDLSQYIL